MINHLRQQELIICTIYSKKMQKQPDKIKHLLSNAV